MERIRRNEKIMKNEKEIRGDKRGLIGRIWKKRIEWKKWRRNMEGEDWKREVKRDDEEEREKRIVEEEKSEEGMLGIIEKEIDGLKKLGNGVRNGIERIENEEEEKRRNVEMNDIGWEIKKGGELWGRKRGKDCGRGLRWINRIWKIGIWDLS